jgi:hypothetical protein
MAALVHLVGIWIAKDIAEGKYPPKFAIPLTFLISRLRTPMLTTAVVGFALEALASRSRFRRARDVTPQHKGRRGTTKRPSRLA